MAGLAPVTATRWDTVEGAPGHLDVRVERWTADDVDLLELSTVTKELDEAESRQSDLLHYVGDLGLAVDPSPQSKTDRVLRHLVTRAFATG